MPDALMKETDFRKIGCCAVCRGKLLEPPGGISFYRVTIEHMFINLRAIERQIGLGMMVGPRLAQVMGPDEHFAQRVDEPLVLAVHEACASDKMAIYELVAEQINKETSRDGT